MPNLSSCSPLGENSLEACARSKRPGYQEPSLPPGCAQTVGSCQHSVFCLLRQAHVVPMSLSFQQLECQQ